MRRFTEPYLLTLHPSTEMNVCRLTSEASDTWVEFGPTPELGNRVSAVQYELHGLRDCPNDCGVDPDVHLPLIVFQQIARIDGLKSGITYYYRVITNDDAGKTYHFRTAPDKGEPFRFVLLSDLQCFDVQDIMRMVGEQDIDFIIYNGDSVNVSWRAYEWFGARNSWFDLLQQDGDGCRLLQYVPIFPCPGNHEVDDYRVSCDKSFAPDLDRYRLSIYMQLFRPLYPAAMGGWSDRAMGRGGKHWYSADWGDMHIVSLSAVRYHSWGGFESPGWFPVDDLSEGSHQIEWLRNDLEANRLPRTWVTMHWHMFNRGGDGWVPFSFPVSDEKCKVTYPQGDWCQDVLKPIFEKNGVTAVSFGHSHVYERYLVNGIHYIEAASIGNAYRHPDDPYHPTGIRPIIEAFGFRSFLIASYNPATGITAEVIQASGEPDEIGKVIDTFTISDDR